MSAQNAANKDIINARVKFRESFRPFCPSIIAEAREDYFADGRMEAFMITSFAVQPEKIKQIPAVVHVDGTARPQMVSQEANPLFWRLIHRYGELTGEPVILNTSFNIKGEPIAGHPRDAIRCFYDSGLDVLILGDTILSK